MEKNTHRNRTHFKTINTKSDQSQHHYNMRSPTRFVKPQRNAQKKIYIFFPFQIWYHPWHHLRVTGSVFPHSTTWSHTVNIYVIFAEGKKNFFYKSSFQPKHLSFSPNYAWYVTHIHYPKQIEGKKGRTKKIFFFLIYIFFLISFFP